MSASTPEFALPSLPTLRTATVFGRKVCYYDIGHGPPLVLLHGVGGDADQWAFCFDGLAATHRVIAIDLPGFGRSDKPLIDYRIGGYVEVLDRLLAAIDIGRASILGHSLGGWVAATFALQIPQKVDRLILCDAAGVDEGAIAIPVDLNVSTRANMREVFRCMFHEEAMVSEGLVDLAYALHLERGDGGTIKSLLETLNAPAEKLDGKLRGIRAPTLVVWGEQDAVTPLAMGQVYQRGIAGSRLHAIARCGHMPPLERPEEFVATVNVFLRSGERGAAS